MDEDNTGEKDERTDENNVLPRRHRRRKRSSSTSNYDQQPETTSHLRPMQECADQREDHTGNNSRSTSLDKRKSGKTSKNEIVMDENYRDREEDTEYKGGGKHVQGSQDEQNKKLKKTSIQVQIDGREPHSSTSESYTTNFGKEKPGKTSKNEKDNENNGGGKQREGNQDEPQKKSKKRIKKYFWDVMKDKRKEERVKVQSDRFWERVQVITKIVVCIFISIFVLATAVISKLCLILITSNMLPPMNDTVLYWWHKTVDTSFRFKGQQTNVQWIWALTLIILAPYIFTVLGSGWQLLLGKKKREFDWKCFGKVMLRETLHSIGICMMAFVLLPSIDPIAGILVCFHVATIPGLLRIVPRFMGCTSAKVNGTCLLTVLLTFAVLLQLAGIALACIYYSLEPNPETRILQVITICLSPFFISCVWWENYFPFSEKHKITPQVDSQEHHGGGTDTNSDAENQVNTPETSIDLFKFRSVKINLVVNLLKIVITLLVPIILFGVQCPNGSECVGTLFGVRLNSTFDNRVGKSVLSSSKSFGDCENYLPLICAVVSIICSGACYYAVQIGCKILAQITCVSIPLTIASPTALAALFWILSQNTNAESCFLSYPLWGTNSSKLLDNIRSHKYGMIIASGICGYISLLIISYHIWIPDKRRLKRSDELFAKPLYCGILTDQSIRLNIMRTRAGIKNKGRTGESVKKTPSSTNPHIYLCATMWHENKSEMKKLMESIIRLDGENSLTREMNEDTKGVFYKDVFNFEVHIFFDDAFETRQDGLGKGNIVLNRYVEDLIQVVQEVAGKLLPRKKSTTEYGGRLHWKLPGGSVMYAHLKNKNSIRVKKRWSQVMYMYFFLGYKFLKEVYKEKGKENIDDILITIADDERLQDRIDNTFIMALDGDVDFKPEAINYLMDKMRKNPMVGAACGRIHPTGNGPVVWYQKFEYAVSHWLHKVTEDVLGCVLCSPGCFSLFRGSALMDKNVIKVYTSSPEKGVEHIQYDLGEDRWLCTLLLQEGYKIEYVAISDAFTEAPEGFNEFFNQRRRWTPSTLANILDLIWDWKHVVKTNPYINRMFILYQLFLMFSTILTPGTILLLIVGAITMAFPSLPLWAALLFTILPVAAFIVICFNATSETQLKFAATLSIVYALVMMIVLVGLVVHMVQNKLCSITTIFFIYVAVIFFTAAVLHPKEFFCVLHGFLYFFAIPCTSLIMMIYALCNLNVTSWGTRETTQKQDTQQGIPHNQSVLLHTSHGIGQLLRCVCCSNEPNQQLLTDKTDSVEKQIISGTHEKTQIREISDRKEMMPGPSNTVQISDAEGSEAWNIDQAKDGEENNIKRTNKVQQSTREDKKISNETEQPLTKRDWMDCPLLKETKEKSITKSEAKFWERMIERYLRPFDDKDIDKKGVEYKLTILRNKVCLFFLMLNAFFICIVFVLQQITAESKIMSIQIPCFTGENRLIYVEPISFAFTFIFGIILTVQFLCMLIHRFRTLIHVWSRAKIFSNEKDFKRDMRRLKAEIPIAQMMEQLEDFIKNTLQSIYVDRITEKSGLNRKTIARRNWVKAVNTQRRRSRKHLWERIKDYARELQDARSKGFDEKKETKKIANKFPYFSKQGHKAIHQYLCYIYAAQQSQTP